MVDQWSRFLSPLHFIALPTYIKRLQRSYSPAYKSGPYFGSMGENLVEVAGGRSVTPVDLPRYCFRTKTVKCSLSSLYILHGFSAMVSFIVSAGQMLCGLAHGLALVWANMLCTHPKEI